MNGERASKVSWCDEENVNANKSAGDIPEIVSRFSVNITISTASFIQLGFVAVCG